jgi:hypothetical protein
MRGRSEMREEIGVKRLGGIGWFMGENCEHWG